MQLMGHCQRLMAQREFRLRHSAYTSTHVDNDHNHVFSPLGNTQPTSDLLGFSWITFLHFFCLSWDITHTQISHTCSIHTHTASPCIRWKSPVAMKLCINPSNVQLITIYLARQLDSQDQQIKKHPSCLPSSYVLVAEPHWSVLWGTTGSC